MPWAPPRPCAEPGCPALIYGPGPSGCPRHQLPPLPPTWPAIRARYLAAHPWCSWPGCTLPATDVDHVIVRADGGTDAWSNLTGYCHPHHSAKTTARDGGLGNPRH